jgi:hypothetical protein
MDNKRTLDVGFENLDSLDIDLQVLASAESLALPELGGSFGTSGCCTHNCGTKPN